MSHPLRDINAPPLSHKCQACLDIVADHFWGGDRNRAFFDVWVFSPFKQELPPSVNATRRMKERKAERMINASEKWAWILLSPSFLHSRRNETNSQCGLQENWICNHCFATLYITLYHHFILLILFDFYTTILILSIVGQEFFLSNCI